MQSHVNIKQRCNNTQRCLICRGRTGPIDRREIDEFGWILICDETYFKLENKYFPDSHAIDAGAEKQARFDRAVCHAVERLFSNDKNLYTALLLICKSCRRNFYWQINRIQQRQDAPDDVNHADFLDWLVHTLGHIKSRVSKGMPIKRCTSNRCHHWAVKKMGKHHFCGHHARIKRGWWKGVYT